MWITVISVRDWEFLGFLSGVADDSVLLEYDAASTGNRIPTIRGNGILKGEVANVLVKIRYKQMGGIYHIIGN